jgi:hypothetical protein
MDTLHDAFISYKSEYLAWVEILARNLRRLGIDVWLDEWHRKPGDRVSVSLQAALDASRAGVLVVTPEAAASGWVQDEYDRMRHLQRTRPDFRLVPVILRETPKFAFKDSLFTVDFRDAMSETVYRRKLHELVCGIRGLQPGDGTVSEPEIKLPQSLGALGRDIDALADASAADGEGSAALFNALLDDLEYHHIAAVFAQEGAQHLVPLDHLLIETRRRFPRDKIHHVVPLICQDDDATAYFSHIAAECGLTTGAADGRVLRDLLIGLLRSGGRHVFIVSHMENGPVTARRDFATQLRHLSEQYRSQVMLLFVGGEKLNELVYHSDQSISILNTAIPTAHDWPSPEPVVLRRHDAAATLSEAELAAITDATGLEPRLMAECLNRRRGLPDAIDVAGVIRQSMVVRQWFAPYQGDDVSVARLCRLLDRDMLGTFDQVYDDELRRRLYWRGAIRKVTDPDGVHRLYWRCEAVRERGRELLRCAQC